MSATMILVNTINNEDGQRDAVEKADTGALALAHNDVHWRVRDLEQASLPAGGEWAVA
jgi:hypothetical protein